MRIAGVRWVACDLADPVSAALLREAFAGADAVVVLAEVIQPSHRPELLHAVNVEGSRRVFVAALEAGVGHLVYASVLGGVMRGLGLFGPAPNGQGKAMDLQIR